jgi:PleD family two-component response regulator
VGMCKEQGLSRNRSANVKAKKKSMLIVDDERMVLDALKMILTFDGYEVQSAESGLEALTYFEPEKMRSGLHGFRDA